ncbi:ethanolamine utilization protein EutH [Proteiniborus sp. MB09-C3]|uniref:ethanolamine utilization protein EutH n=1 Tax=Proteiniborus sp. MB09-C3 TaxID=3050072 RepID=UPI0025565E96|nr:ethanolamine utilization protein EutH [Proteiniborus sp. MB09-C3]WIV12334.1 ethanolamine utilization protein EutH [Proteiniborus sp. MB09-C3]
MNEIVLYIIFVFAVLGCIDRVLGNKFGIGEKFEEGFKSMGNMAMSIIGIYSLAPVISSQLSKIIGPLFEVIGADPSILPGSILACDMGGYISAAKMAQTKELGLFSGLILASMLGATVVFTIPIGAGIIEKKDQYFFTKGILLGIVTLPLGSIFGGILLGINISTLIINMIPIILLAAFLALGLIKWPDKLIKGFGYFSKVIVTIGAIGLMVSIFERISGIVIIPGMEPFDEGLKIVGSIAIVLCGAYPMMHIVTKVFRGPLSKLGEKMGIGENVVAGVVVSLANNVPAFLMMKDMDDRGKVICSAFAVSGAFTFGGQLGFVAGIEKTVIVPFIVSKLLAGISAVILAIAITRNFNEHSKSTYAKGQINLDSM